MLESLRISGTKWALRLLLSTYENVVQVAIWRHKLFDPLGHLRLFDLAEYLGHILETVLLDVVIRSSHFLSLSMISGDRLIELYVWKVALEAPVHGAFFSVALILFVFSFAGVAFEANLLGVDSVTYTRGALPAFTRCLQSKFKWCRSVSFVLCNVFLFFLIHSL